MKLSIVTAVKNRPEHIAKSAAAISAQDFHFEHIIVDWASNPPVQRQDLPDDQRIVLVRVNGNMPWWLAGAYNLGFAIASGDAILKSDADILPGPEFLLWVLNNCNQAGFSCGRLTSQEWMMDSSLYPSSGLFWAKRQALVDVRGFNPLIYGWGWDDIDLYTRLFSAGHIALRLKPLDTVELNHSSQDRKAGLFDCCGSLDLPPKHFPDFANNISNLINARISVFCAYSLLQFPKLSQYLDLLHSGNTVEKHFQSLRIPENELNSILNECLDVVWRHQRDHADHKIFSYMRWKLKSKVYKQSVLANFICGRIIPLHPSETLR
jgi:glycosyltransferase involved in cell wall biosynthesis